MITQRNMLCQEKEGVCFDLEFEFVSYKTKPDLDFCINACMSIHVLKLLGTLLLYLSCK